MKKHSLSTVFLITVSLILYVLAYPIDASYHTRAAIKLCAEAIVPTLFIFMVLSRILSHICSHKAFDGKIIKFLSTFFNIPSCIIPLCLTGIICGAPTGAFGICRMYDEGLCTKKEAEKACILASNCSAAFILGFVAAVLGSKIHTIYIFVTNTLTTLLVYLIFFKDKTAKSDAKLKVRKVYLSELITESISSSVTSTITLCGYIILFYTFIQIVCEKLTYFLSCIGLSKTNITLTSAVTASLFEVSSGVLQSVKVGGNLSVVLCSGAVAFTGFSIIFQVTGIMKKSGKVIFIDTSCENILKNSSLLGRPLLKDDKNRIYNLYELRYEKYIKSADYIYKNDKDIKSAVEEISKFIIKNR